MDYLKWYSCKRSVIIFACIKAKISVFWVPQPACLRAEPASGPGDAWTLQRIQSTRLVRSMQQGDRVAPASDCWVYFLILYPYSLLSQERGWKWAWWLAVLCLLSFRFASSSEICDYVFFSSANLASIIARAYVLYFLRFPLSGYRKPLPPWD